MVPSLSRYVYSLLFSDKKGGKTGGCLSLRLLLRSFVVREERGTKWLSLVRVRDSWIYEIYGFVLSDWPQVNRLRCVIQITQSGDIFLSHAVWSVYHISLWINTSRYLDAHIRIYSCGCVIDQTACEKKVSPLCVIWTTHLNVHVYTVLDLYICSSTEQAFLYSHVLSYIASIPLRFRPVRVTGGSSLLKSWWSWKLIARYPFQSDKLDVS